MSSEGLAIRANGVGKRYRRGRAPAAGGLTGRIGTTLRRLRGANSSIRATGDDYFWALRDVDFDVRHGEVVGLLGRNGAGKSTLLKILSRITRPTTGRIEIDGRTASLLEVGTGFNQELTGKENVYLNGAILGMRRVEIDRKFDEIVAFSEVEAFLHTPVKYYSSGMYVRLAFAVAAHLEADILIVDEVLAVGDAAFQRKCLGKISSVAGEGRTVLFVTHHVSMVKTLCTRAILLEDGRVALDGDVETAIGRYLGDPQASTTGVIANDAMRIGTGEARIRAISVCDACGSRTPRLRLGQAFQMAFRLEAFRPIRDSILELGISTTDGLRVVTMHSTDDGATWLDFEPGIHELVVDIDAVLLPRDYVVDVGISFSSGVTMDWVERAVAFSVVNVVDGQTAPYRPAQVRGFVRPPTRWRLLSRQL
jgi:homopolymeric O-antigen transport system ATP-binding protein